MIFTFETKAHCVSQVIPELESSCPSAPELEVQASAIAHQEKIAVYKPQGSQNSRLKKKNERVTAWSK